MNTLSLCMIVKDGEKYIEQCIESVLPAIKDIIIVDTGSSDSTLEKIKRFNPSVYQMEWKNNFANARNASLKYASGDYIIVLDADEVVYAEDLPKLIETIRHTNADCISIRFHNFIDENDESSFNIHEGLRIFKNGSYHFKGAIHEQPIFNFSGRKPVIEHSDVRVKHYGYLKSNAGEKKFDRNMTILKETLEKSPKEPFHLFNMGNQYMSIGDYKTALEFYDKADKYKDITLAYSPHLIFRRASCLKNSRKGNEGLAVIEEGLKYYPACTDLEFLRGLTLTGMKRFTLAIDSFKRCIEMGPAPPNLCFLPDTANVRPHIELAEIYSSMDDHKKALEHYLKAISIDGKRYYLIYKVAASLNKIFADKTIVYQNICNLFADSSYQPNVMVITDALLNEKLFEQASFALDRYMKKGSPVVDSDIYFLKGRISFYSKDYQSAFLNFKKSISPETAKGILPNTKNRAYEFMTACGLLCSNCYNSFMNMKESMGDSMEKSVYFAFFMENSSPLDDTAFTVLYPILSNLLTVKEYDVFEKALNVLNLVESKDVLLWLAKIYFDNNFHDMAVKTILRSIKELDALDSKAVMILNREFIM